MLHAYHLLQAVVPLHGLGIPSTQLHPVKGQMVVIASAFLASSSRLSSHFKLVLGTLLASAGSVLMMSSTTTVVVVAAAAAAASPTMTSTIVMEREDEFLL